MRNGRLLEDSKILIKNFIKQLFYRAFAHTVTFFQYRYDFCRKQIISFQRRKSPFSRSCNRLCTLCDCATEYRKRIHHLLRISRCKNNASRPHIRKTVALRNSVSRKKCNRKNHLPFHIARFCRRVLNRHIRTCFHTHP